MRRQAILAIGEISDPIAVPALIPFLSERISDDALRKLGEDGLVDAFNLVLRAKVRPFWKRLRKQVDTASLVWMARTFMSEFAEANYEVLDSCINATAKLRLLATLPRPASYVPVDTSVLPRPASSTEVPSKENLPSISQT